MQEPIKQIHVVTKTIWNCLLGILEYIGIPLLIAYLSTFLSPIFGEHILWQWIERTAFCFTIYEVVIVGIRKTQIDVRNDALLALMTAYKTAELYCESDNQDIYDNLKLSVKRVLDNGVLNQIDIIKSYNNLLKFAEQKDITSIKYNIIYIQLLIDGNKLLWKYTLLLRLFKE